MSMVLPRHLVAHTFGTARGRAGRCMAIVALLAAAIGAAPLKLPFPDFALWPAAGAMAAFALTAALLFDDFSWPASLFYLLVGAGATFLYAVVIASQTALPPAAAALLTLPQIALICVGGGEGHGTLTSLGWMTAAWIVGEAAVALALVPSSRDWAPSVDVAVFFVFMAAIVVFSRLWVRAVPRPVVPTLYRAVREEELSRIRGTVETQSSALIHDIVLNRLAAITLTPPGEIDAELRARIQSELAQLVGQEWLHEPAEAVPNSGQPRSGLFAVIDVARADGLDVEVSGNLDSLTRLDPATDRALSLAVHQCLGNVLKHSGTNRCQLSVSTVDDSLMVMVVDDGAGFDPTATSADRLGIRQSITGRIEEVGGWASIWSTPGEGTSVVLRVPLLTDEDRHG